jgi:hypothetical protein
MTWGQIRLLCQKSAPEVDLDLIDGWLNTRYEKVLQATDWTGIGAHATIQTTAAYQSGADSATFTVGSTAVIGSLTAWTAAISGQKIYRPGDTVTYTATYFSATALTLDRPYEGIDPDAPGTLYAAAAYVFFQDIYPLPGDCSSVIEILNPQTGFPLDQMSKFEMDACVGERTLVDTPEIFAVCDDSPETAPPVIHQVQFYPPPLFGRGFKIHYRRAALGFDGGDTSASPLPFLGSLVLIAGVRADIFKHLGKLQQGLAYEAEFKDALADLVRAEHQQRKKKPVMKMAPRFTRHRLARVERGLQDAWRGGTPGGPS